MVTELGDFGIIHEGWAWLELRRGGIGDGDGMGMEFEYVADNMWRGWVLLGRE